ncbi:DUF192 domain-containing protein [Sphingomonas oligophenolica]|uniref:DUF192 domain-containing protein n=1 Tax=Sphingomonas oligophenolica TaxID=301154 RepID=A0A502CKJ0_9SPHN|nr:DUF192 domain-containing protein [Sphingomonas oligophenolica]TPG13090.1 DUF192 domain-containing protein [Sphingomonas oligophenolica]
MTASWRLAAATLGVALALAGCKDGRRVTPTGYCSTAPTGRLPVAIKGTTTRHCLSVERATTAAEQEQGLMFRTDLAPDGGMLFWPYPAGGGAPQDANFWMKNTPTPLDILFIRADGTIARIAENTIPFSETPIPSGEPVAAVLELVGGRAAALGIAEGDTVTWPHGSTSSPAPTS